MKNPRSSKRSKDNQTIIKTMESLFARLSFGFEHIIFKHPFVIMLYFFIQTLFQVILPSFAATAILAQKLGSETLMMVASFSKLLFVELISFSSEKQALILIIQSFIIAIIIGVVISLKSDRKKFLKLSLYIFTLISCMSSFLLNAQYQFFSASQLSENTILSKIVTTIIVLNIIFILLMNIFYKLVAHTYSFSQSNQLLPKFSITDIIIELIKKLSGILIYIDLRYKTGVLTTVYLSLMFIITLGRLYNQITFYSYLSEKTTLIYHKILTIQSSTLFTTLLLIITSEGLLAHNYLIQIVVLFVFSSFTLSRLIESRQIHYQLLTQKQIQSQSQAILYVIQANRLIKKVKTKPAQGLVLVSMVKQHRQKCIDINCECKTERYFSCQSLVYSLTQRLSEKYKDDNFFILSLYIRLTIHDNFTARLALKKSKYLSGNSQNHNFFTRIMLQKYSALIHQYIQQKENFLGVAQTQKSFQSDNNIEKLLSKIVEVSKCREQFWKFFKKGAIIRKQFEDICAKQLQRMKQINKIKNQILTEFSNDLVLTSFVIAYEKYVLLKDRPSKKLNQCLEKQRILSHSFTRKVENQQGKIEKFLHSSWVCSLQCSLQPDDFGNITRASSNSLAILNYLPQSLINCNINIIIPKTIQKQHTELMLGWYKRCSWGNIGKLRQIYCTDKKNISFSSKVYLKVTHKHGDNSGVNLMATIFKENENDLVILDEKLCIIGIGQTFMNLFGQIVIGLPFEFICPDGVIGNICTLLEEREQRKVYRSSFYSTSKIMHLLKGYHEKNYDMKYTSKELLLQKLREDQRNLSESQITVIEYELKPYRVGKVFLIIFKIVNIVSNNQHVENKKELFQSRHIANLQEQNSSKDNFKKQQQIQEQICFTPSVASSSVSSASPFQMNVDHLQSVFYGYFYREDRATLASKPTNIMDRKILKLVLVIILFSVAGIFICSVKLFFNYKGFEQIRGLFFGDGACSDNLQLSMFIYNKAINLYDSTQHPTSITSQQNIYYELTNRYQQQYLQSLIKSEIFKVSQQLSNLTNIPIYGYQNILTTWVNLDRSQIKIQTIKFINNFLYYVDRICKLSEDITIMGDFNSTGYLQRKTYIRNEKLIPQLSDKMKTLYFNFPRLYQLNTDYLNYYTGLFQSCRDKIKLIGYIKISSSLLLTLLILAFLYYHYSARNHQIQGIYEEFSKVDRETVQTLFQYYREVSNGIENRDKFMNNNKNKTNILSNNQFATSKFISISKLHQQKISARFNPAGSTKVITKRHSLFLPDLSMLILRVIFVIIMIVIGVLNLSMITTQSAILDTSGKMMEDINGLMNSQNQLIGAYFTLKGEYVINGRKFHYDKEQKQLLQMFVTQVNKIETQFNKVAVGSLNTFSQYDPLYVSKMINILAQSICQLIKEQVPLTVHSQCIKNQQIKMVQKGVINAMTYFGRTVQQNIILYTNFLGQIPMFPKIDKSLLYMFKIYQKTQSQIVDSLVIAVKNQNIQYLLYITAELIFFSGCVAYMMYFFKRQNNESVSRLGRILLLPIKYIKSNKNIMRNFQKVCDVSSLNYL